MYDAKHMDGKMIFFQKGCIYSIILIFILPLFVYSQDTVEVTPDTNRLTIVFAGDIMGHDGQIAGAWDSATKTYNYEPTFRYIRDYISDADIAVANLEVTLAGPPYKGYPQFSSPDALAAEAKRAGFDVLAMANNHALDGGQKGFKRTLQVIDSLQFLHLGTYRDSAERDSNYPLVIEKKHIRIALLNYTYGTNGLKISAPFIINRIDTTGIKYDLKKARLADPDFIIAFMHWGVEYERNENAEQRELASFLIMNGVNIIIGSHPHVVQPIRYIKTDSNSNDSVPVVYSLGNFVSNQRTQYRDGGIVAELHLTTCNRHIIKKEVCYLPYWVWRKDSASQKKIFFVVPIAAYESDPQHFELNNSDINRLKLSADETRKHLDNVNESDYYPKK